MNERWITAAIGGLGGAALALAIVFGASMAGLLPGAGDARIKSYLMAHPDLVVTMMNKVQAQQVDSEQHERQAAVDKVGTARFFDTSVAYVTGPASAKNTFVEFFDYNCIHCRNTFPVVQKFYEAHKNDTRFAFIDYPIFGQESMNAARAAVAARRQGNLYIALHFALMGTADAAVTVDTIEADAKKSGIDVAKLSADVLDPNIDKTLAAAHKLAGDALITGTPAFIINGKVHEGEISDAEIKKLLKS